MEDDCSEIIKIVKNILTYKGSLSCTLILISFMLFVYKISANNNETVTTEDAVIRWYEQLPEDHWIKADDDFNSIFYDLMNIEQGLLVQGKGFIKRSYIEMSQSKDYASRFFAKIMQKEIEDNKKRYHLKYVHTNKNIKKVIRVDAGESVQIGFYCDEEEMLFDFTMEQYVAEIQYIDEDVRLDVTNRIVLSYVDNPEIATVFNGKITGLQKGKTKLHLCCNGYDIQYIVKVN